MITGLKDRGPGPLDYEAINGSGGPAAQLTPPDPMYPSYQPVTPLSRVSAKNFTTEESAALSRR